MTPRELKRIEGNGAFPDDWIVAKQGGESEMHFCSFHCLHEWVEKQMEVKPMSEMFPDAFKSIDPNMAIEPIEVDREAVNEYWRDL
ncbi:MAG TPA: hypothetical protein VF974_06060 [Patescibacteria group bacterium]